MDRIHKVLVSHYQTVKTQTASYLDLHYLARPFWQATQCYRFKNIYHIIMLYVIFLSL